MSAIYLIRHGQASFAAADYDQLSPLGEQQSRRLGSALTTRIGVPAGVICGGMRRHAQTAAACLGAMNLPAQWQIDNAWDEFDHNDVLGVYQPRYRQQSAIAADVADQADPRAAFQALFGAALARWAGGQHDAEYRESWRAFCERVEQGLAQMQAALGRGETLLVFTSGGAISVVCRQLLGLSDERALRINLTLANASITKLLVGRSGVHLGSLNEHAHLESASREGGLVSYR